MVGVVAINPEGKSFIMGISGIGMAVILSVAGFVPLWILFGVLVIAGVLYESKFFATGIVGGFASGVFAYMDWLPIWIYFSAIVLGALFLAIQMAGKYVNTGATGQ